MSGKLLRIGIAAAAIVALSAGVAYWLHSVRADASGGATHPQWVSGSDIPVRAGYEMVIASFAVGGRSNLLAARMNVDQARAAEISAEFSDFIETRTRRQEGFLRDTCDRRDSIRTIDELANELNEGLLRNERSVDELLAELLSKLTDSEAERLGHLAEGVRANAVSTKTDFRAYYRSRGEVDLQEELARICSADKWAGERP